MSTVIGIAVYSTEIRFLYQSTGRLWVPGCRDNHVYMSNKYAKHIYDSRFLESKLRSALSSPMHPCPGNWAAIGHAVVHNAHAAHAFIAGIKCRHCRYHADAGGARYMRVISNPRAMIINHDQPSKNGRSTKQKHAAINCHTSSSIMYEQM